MQIIIVYRLEDNYFIINFPRQCMFLNFIQSHAFINRSGEHVKERFITRDRTRVGSCALLIIIESTGGYDYYFWKDGGRDLQTIPGVMMHKMSELPGSKRLSLSITSESASG